jgi:hypothetical protein
MENPQARIRASQALPTEEQLAHQAGLPLENGIESQKDEATVVETPQRSLPLQGLIETSLPPSSPGKRKSRTSSAKQTVPIPSKKQKLMKELRRQGRDNSLQSAEDEIKRFEAYAEKINQLLATQASKWRTIAQPTDQMEELARSQAPAQPSVQSAKTVDLPEANGMPPRPSPQADADTLEAQLDHMYQLLVEAAIADESPPAKHSASEDDIASTPTPGSQAPLLEPSSLAQSPSSRSTPYPLPTSPILDPVATLSPDPNRTQAEQDAIEAAEALQYLANRDRGSASVGRPRGMGSRFSESSVRQYPPRQNTLRLKRLLNLPQDPVGRVGDAVLWVVIPAVIRIGARLLIATYPALTPILTLFSLAPAVLAVYLVFFAPNANALLLYRLFLIMLGFLIGSKL